MELGARSSRLLFTAAACAFVSALAVPASVLLCSDEAINVAFPK